MCIKNFKMMPTYNTHISKDVTIYKVRLIKQFVGSQMVPVWGVAQEMGPATQNRNVTPGEVPTGAPAQEVLASVA